MEHESSQNDTDQNRHHSCIETIVKQEDNDVVPKDDVVPNDDEKVNNDYVELEENDFEDDLDSGENHEDAMMKRDVACSSPRANELHQIVSSMDFVINVAKATVGADSNTVTECDDSYVDMVYQFYSYYHFVENKNKKTMLKNPRKNNLSKMTEHSYPHFMKNCDVALIIDPLTSTSTRWERTSVYGFVRFRIQNEQTLIIVPSTSYQRFADLLLILDENGKTRKNRVTKKEGDPKFLVLCLIDVPHDEIQKLRQRKWTIPSPEEQQRYQQLELQQKLQRQLPPTHLKKVRYVDTTECHRIEMMIGGMSNVIDVTVDTARESQLQPQVDDVVLDMIHQFFMQHGTSHTTTVPRSGDDSPIVNTNTELLAASNSNNSSSLPKITNDSTKDHMDDVRHLWKIVLIDMYNNPEKQLALLVNCKVALMVHPKFYYCPRPVREHVYHIIQDCCSRTIPLFLIPYSLEFAKKMDSLSSSSNSIVDDCTGCVSPRDLAYMLHDISDDDVTDIVSRVRQHQQQQQQQHLFTLTKNDIDRKQSASTNRKQEGDTDTAALPYGEAADVECGIDTEIVMHNNRNKKDSSPISEESIIYDLCQKYKPMHIPETRFLWSITYDTFEWEKRLSDKSPLLVIIIADNCRNDNENNNDEYTTARQRQQHNVSANIVIRFCLLNKILHLVVQRSSEWKELLADNSIGQSRNLRGTVRRYSKTIALCFTRVKDIDEDKMKYLQKEARKTPCMVHHQTRVDESENLEEIDVPTTIDQMLYNLFKRNNNVPPFWYITKDGPSNWSTLLENGSMLTIVLGSTNDSDGDALVDEIVSVLNALNKDYFIVQPTLFWICRMMILCCREQNDEHLIVAMCLPRIQFDDASIMCDLKMKAKLSLYDAMGDGCTPDVELAIRKWRETYKSNIRHNSNRNDKERKAEISLIIETDSQKLIDTIEDGRISLVLLKKVGLSNRTAKDPLIEIVSSCIRFQTPYIWVTNSELFENIPSTDDMEYLGLLKPAPDDALKHRQIESDLADLLEMFSRNNAIKENQRKGRDRVWPAIVGFVECMNQTTESYLIGHHCVPRNAAVKRKYDDVGRDVLDENGSSLVLSSVKSRRLSVEDENILMISSHDDFVDLRYGTQKHCFTPSDNHPTISECRSPLCIDTEARKDVDVPENGFTNENSILDDIDPGGSDMILETFGEASSPNQEKTVDQGIAISNSRTEPEKRRFSEFQEGEISVKKTHLDIPSEPAFREKRRQPDVEATLNNSHVSTQAGSASICDNEGHLLIHSLETSDIGTKDDASTVSIEMDTTIVSVDSCGIRLEEEIALLEIELKAIKARLVATEKQLSHGQENLNTVACRITNSKGLSRQLERALDKHESLLVRSTQTIEKSQLALQRLMEADVTVEEIAQLSVVQVDGDVPDGASPRNDAVPRHTDDLSDEGDIGSALLPTTETIITNFLRKDNMPNLTVTAALPDFASHPAIKSSWDLLGDSDCYIAPFLVSIKTKLALLSALSLCSREILVLDVDESSGSHRREAMWNTCIDVRQMTPIDQYGRLRESSQDCAILEARTNDNGPVSTSGIDPDISLCPYELMGKCADPYCSYQHLAHREQGPVLPRELVPLPRINLNSVATNWHCSSKDLGEKVEASKPDYVSAGSVANNDDFLTVPPADLKECIHWDDAIRCWIENARLKPYWWITEGQIDSLRGIKNPISAIGLMDLIFDMLHGPSETSIIVYGCDQPKTTAEGCVFSGMVIDVFRLAIHTGRFDVTQALLSICTNISCSWDNTNDCQSANRFVAAFNSLSECLRVLEERAVAFESVRGKNLFETAFEIQLSLAVLSYLFETLHKNETGGSGTPLPDCSRIFCSLNQIFTANRQTSADSAYDFSRALRDFISDEQQSDDDVGIFDVDFLLQDFSWGLRLKNLVRANKSPRSIIDTVLVPSLCGSNRMIRNAATLKDFSFNSAVKVTILISFAVLGALESIVHRIQTDEEVDTWKLELAELHTTIDDMLQSHQSFMRSIPLIDMLLAPVFAANVAFACTIKCYDKAQNRLTDLLSKKHLHRSGLEISMTSLSELLWSQLLQMQFSLPAQISTEETAVLMSGLNLPDELCQLHNSLATLVFERDVFPHHLSFPNDWNLLRAQMKSKETLSTDPAGASRDKLSFSFMIMHQVLLGETSKPFGFDFMRNPLSLRSTRGKPSPLRHAIPFSLILSASGLTDLNLSSSGIRKLPHHFGYYFSNLKHLDLSENQLDVIPESSIELVELQTFNVNNNSLNSFPASFAPTKLRILRAARNKLRSLPFAFAGCNDLEVLDFDGNPVDASFWSIAGSFTRLRELLPSR